MVKYLITESEKTALESKICEIAGVSGPLEFPDGFTNTISTITFPPMYSLDKMLNIDGFPDIIETNDITYLNHNAFYGITKLQIINIPECSFIGNDAFLRCSNLSYVFLSKIITIGASAFAYCSRLISLYLMSTSIVQFNGIGPTDTFYSTPFYDYSEIAGRYGSIFVPTSLLSDYQNHGLWSYVSERFVGV